MNEINQFFVAGDKFMPEINLRQPGFMYSTGRPCSKNKECKNLKKQDKGWFQDYMVYEDFKGLPRRTASGNKLDKI